MPTDLTPTIPKAILCDMDGVLRHWESASPLEEEFGLPTGSFLTCAFADDLITPAITGACTDEEWRAAIVERLSESVPSEVAEIIVGRWSEPSGRIDHELLDLLGTLRERGHTVVLVTNATTRLMDDLTKLAIHDRFDGIVNSAVVGIAKPDPAIYRFAAELAGVDPTGCVFIDDLAANVTAASQLGMTGLHFTGIESVRALVGDVMNEVVISEVSSLPVEEITPLANEATSEGFAFVQRLLNEYASGDNRFNRAGEALFIAREGSQVVGVCGLNQDPYSGDPRVGRVRRMYVLPSCRARGIGRSLLTTVVDRATDGFDQLVLRTNDAPAAAFYERCGFTRIDDPTDTTHKVDLR